ncbi:hypothetical protein P3T76_011079 [Phytophthora citrophthora]|uniref:Survival motor neuron Tudor domain-containing protein n=1 Tax=Phytophthora citrophthora TaxID=4793 RepID=A0AAD9G9X3_9STRA|nr:hypothetical protein P3T76_011079 [Phytophthora citrophthora]
MLHSSVQDSEEQWDDMAIVRAFEEALADQRSRKSTSATPARRKNKAAPHSNGKKGPTSVSIEEDDEDEDQQNDFGHATAGVGMFGQPNTAAYTGYAAGSNPFVYQGQQPQQQTSSEMYQAAYAQAYAHLQGQFQATYPGAAQQQMYGPGTQTPAFPAQSPYYPPPPSMPSVPMPFPSVPGVTPSFPRPTPSATDSNDSLANMLMSWYQSGYYTGRFQAMQEMKAQGRQ